jgi:hypothetical protein
MKAGTVRRCHRLPLESDNPTRNETMRFEIAAATIALAALLSGGATTAASAAENGRFCLTTEGSDQRNCSYQSLAACRYFAQSESGICAPNPEFMVRHPGMPGLR